MSAVIEMIQNPEFMYYFLTICDIQINQICVTYRVYEVVSEFKEAGLKVNVTSCVLNLVQSVHVNRIRPHCAGIYVNHVNNPFVISLRM